MTVSPKPKGRDNIQRIKPDPQTMRSTVRRTVVWPATFYVEEHEFRATLYDISTGGLRMKLALALEVGTLAAVKVKNQVKLNVQVVWCADEFMGLKFTDPEAVVSKVLGELPIVLE